MAVIRCKNQGDTANIIYQFLYNLNNNIYNLFVRYKFWIYHKNDGVTFNGIEILKSLRNVHEYIYIQYVAQNCDSPQRLCRLVIFYLSVNFVLSGNKIVHTYSLGSCLICVTSPKNLLGFSEKKPVHVYISSHPIKIIPLIFWIWLESSLQELPTHIGKYTSGALELENPMCFGTHRCPDWWNFNFPRLIPFLQVYIRTPQECQVGGCENHFHANSR